MQIVLWAAVYRSQILPETAYLYTVAPTHPSHQHPRRPNLSQVTKVEETDMGSESTPYSYLFLTLHKSMYLSRPLSLLPAQWVIATSAS